MPASQLKRLKASLREQGIVGPQQSKKQKKNHTKDERGRNERRLQRGAALENIREQFNPFQFKTNARGPKFDVTTDKPEKKKGILGRPGMAKALGEERRKETLLVEMQRRNRVGGIFDRRFGEGDPSMTPETAAAQRFAMEKQKAHKKTSMFDLEDDEDPSQGVSLTHAGKSLNFDATGELLDDFDEEFSDNGSDMSDLEEHNRKRLKRLRDQVASHEEGDQEEPERKKTKKEVMEEVIAKSKMYKYERQAAKEDDEDLRLALDKETSDIRRLLMSKNRIKELEHQQTDSKTAALAGVDKDAFEKDYDLAVRKMVADKRAKPTTRTKTEEQIAEEQSKRLRELEDKRMRRMRGEEVSDSEEREDEDEEEDEDDGSDDAQEDKRPAVEIIKEDDGEADFGLGKGIKMRPTAAELGFDDEDDFLIDDGLVASGSDLDEVDDDSFDESDDDEAAHADDDEDDEFTKGLLTETETKDAIFNESRKGQPGGQTEDGLPYTFPCPQSHAEFLEVLEDIPLVKLPTVVQRIRALYHPKLLSTNKEKLGNFSKVLVQHIAYMGSMSNDDLHSALEMLIRHVHSLAKMFPVEIAQEFRSYLEEMEEQRPLALNVGDLYMLTAIGSIFPTSDHFHQVLTPAMLSMGRFLGQKIPDCLADYAIGTYLTTLALQYQKLAKRYVPEVMNFTLNTLCALAPVQPRQQLGFFPVHEPSSTIRTQDAQKVTVRKLRSADCRAVKEQDSSADAKGLKIALLNANIALLTAASETWTGKASFKETFEPGVSVLKHLVSKNSRPHLPEAVVREAERSSTHLTRAIQVATLSRRPLELHHHKPLAIKTYIPKFEDDFDPDKHYDPDRERAEMAKLKAEHKKERKGAMRELRKDANFMAREKLRLKKEKDAAYEKKYKRLVSEIQGEEGHESKIYEKEKAARKRSKR
ncbi:nucleolar complex protein 14 [Gnomoniopsis smithogilvyi]|uniref:Nucleolar complex protein 14 n=1 Tax=Gnomoniopsis smithogilvyi TaxID=1191159 RepID=A0A9W8Z5H3_9PEZI|nr:nucleolar complex protein 14 [Gnomoniopsis smithogilvyi]